MSLTRRDVREITHTDRDEWLSPLMSEAVGEFDRSKHHIDISPHRMYSTHI